MAQATTVITWEDVSALMCQIERDYTVHMRYGFQRPDRIPQNRAMTVWLDIEAVGNGSKKVGTVRVQTHYPQRRYKTMPGCLVSLAYEALEKLEARRREMLVQGVLF